MTYSLRVSYFFGGNMKQYLKFSLFIGGILLFLLAGVGFFQYTSIEEEIEEEAFPIWEEDHIIGLNYEITMGKNIDNQIITVTTHILDSIYHYKDIQEIEQFLVNFVIHNHTKYSYFLKDVYVIDTVTNMVMADISYSKGSMNNHFQFSLTRKNFQNYDEKYRIQVVLER